MATKIYCDRCGKRIYEVGKRQRVIFENGYDEDRSCEVWDLCENCADAFMDILRKDFSENLQKERSKT